MKRAEFFSVASSFLATVEVDMFGNGTDSSSDGQGGRGPASAARSSARWFRAACVSLSGLLLITVAAGWVVSSLVSTPGIGVVSPLGWGGLLLAVFVADLFGACMGAGLVSRGFFGSWREIDCFLFLIALMVVSISLAPCLVGLVGAGGVFLVWAGFLCWCAARSVEPYYLAAFPEPAEAS